jgi:DNA-binding NtrC family response regulator
MTEKKGSPLCIVVADDEPGVLKAVCATLELGGFGPTLPCADSRDLMALLSRNDPDVLLLDLNMPHMDGYRLLPSIREEHPDLPVIVVTAVEDVAKAVDCMRLGTLDYLVKPVDRQKLLDSVGQAITIRMLRREGTSPMRHPASESLKDQDAFKGILYCSARMHKLLRYAESVAHSPHTVLITGETGVGKELIAQGVHRASGRRGELVCVNVAGYDDNMLADSLFGHGKGAFTGAEHARAGLLENAAGGTLLLDEIGDLSIGSQVKLLRLMEGGEYYPLGVDSPRRSTARLLVATNRDLPGEIVKGTFRKDLYYRLCTHQLQVPPLRERPEDIKLLLEHFVQGAALENGKDPPVIPADLLLTLRSYAFPGNVRELRAMVFDAVRRHRSGPLTSHLFRAAIQQAGAGSFSQEQLFEACDRLPSLREATHALISEALKRSQGNQAAAARMLGISPQALNQRLKHS